MKKVAIFVHAGENELGRAVHGLVYAEELNASGNKFLDKQLKSSSRSLPSFPF
ncbi:hypothetical protein [Aneurinibacillus danicus]|uniref:Uncharacterized protein n=1 Tax=Aneurinibacillus danicus TaxID=267746 RepID=A0A511V512_9BACL|nr:hypothetical protein [Aneurinibacillus danicus]GEN34004.1 hypothetical protein ADA01nite_14640 [Aneurinibacillus danicus]